jgi:hypothetical protein
MLDIVVGNPLVLELGEEELDEVTVAGILQGISQFYRNLLQQIIVRM